MIAFFEWAYMAMTLNGRVFLAQREYILEKVMSLSLANFKVVSTLIQIKCIRASFRGAHSWN